MPPTLPDADWKAFRALREKALERFYRGVLAEIGDLCRDDSLNDHDRYVSIYQRLEQRDAERSRAFDDARRSTMILQLLTIVRLGLVERDELKRFTPATRETIESLCGTPILHSPRTSNPEK